MGRFEVPSELIHAINSKDEFVIIGHKNPDGDCLSSQKALGSLLKKRGKTVYLVSPGPFDRPEIEDQKKYFQPHLPQKTNNALAIVVDCSTIDRVDYLGEELKDWEIAVIDHHDSGSGFGSISYVKPEAPSTTLLIFKLFEYFDITPSKEEAELLLFGIATDTGFFRHLDSESEELFLCTAKLCSAGASPKEAFAEMYGGRTLQSKILVGKLLSRVKSEFDGKLLITFETKDDVLQFGKENRDSDTLYQQLFGIENVEAIVLLRYESEKEISVGLRSKFFADVGQIAKSFNGGGHKKAAGFSWNGSQEEILEKLLNIFRTIF